MTNTLRKRNFFIAGSGTDIGKTIVTRAILQYLIHQGNKAIGYKPVKISTDNLLSENILNDAEVLCNSSSIQLPHDIINPITLLESEILGNTGPLISFERLSQGVRYLENLADNVIIEGTGGWRVLLSGLQPLSNWVIKEKFPVIMVVGIQNGCINHALLTAEAIARDGLTLVGWIANRVNPGMAYYGYTLNALKQLLPAPILGEIPYLSKPEARDLNSYLDLSSLS